MRLITQGESPQDDRQLFASLGTLLTDLRVHQQLGMAITSQAGDIWLLYEATDGVYAFAQLRPLKSRKAAHLRYLYGTADAQRDLLARVIDLAMQQGLRELHTNDRAGHQELPAAGFTIRPNNRQGAFVRWQLDLQEPQA
jgi:hypothetical protein